MWCCGEGGGWKQTADIYKSYENNFFTHKILRNSNLLSAPEETLIKFPHEMWDKFYISYKNIAFTCEYKVFKRHYFIYLVSKQKVVCRHLENIISKMTQNWKKLSFCIWRSSFFLSGQQILFTLSLNHVSTMSKPNYCKIG